MPKKILEKIKINLEMLEELEEYLELSRDELQYYFEMLSDEFQDAFDKFTELFYEFYDDIMGEDNNESEDERT